MNKTAQGALIGGVVLLVLLAIVVAFKTLGGGNPPPAKVDPSLVKPDPLPEGSNRQPPPSRGGTVGG